MALAPQIDQRFRDSAEYYFTGIPCKNGHVTIRYMQSRLKMFAGFFVTLATKE